MVCLYINISDVFYFDEFLNIRVLKSGSFSHGRIYVNFNCHHINALRHHGILDYQVVVCLFILRQLVGYKEYHLIKSALLSYH